MHWHRLHRIAAGITGLFLAVHLTNHLAGLLGVEAHLRFMQAARTFYRQPPLEALLLVAFLLQGLSGVMLVWQGRRTRKDWVPKVQAAAGLYLLVFLLIHVGAVLHGRWVLGLDTNVHFAASGIHAGFGWFFFPYYGLAVLSLFVHLGCALHAHWAGALRPWLVPVAALLGLVAALLVGLFLAGRIHPMPIPDPYLAPWKGTSR